MHSIFLYTIFCFYLFQNVHCNVLLSHAKLTMYWISFESDFTGPKDTILSTCQGNFIANVSNDYAIAVRLEGIGILDDGRMISLGSCNCGSGFSCFDVLNQTQAPWGFGSNNNPLKLWTTVAANNPILPYGKIIYVSNLDGLIMPNGATHNGCLQVGDNRRCLGNNQINFFAGRKIYYEELNSKYGNQLSTVVIQDTPCQILTFDESIQSTTNFQSLGNSTNVSPLVSSTNPSSFFFPIWSYVVIGIGVILIVAVIVSVLLFKRRRKILTGTQTSSPNAFPLSKCLPEYPIGSECMATYVDGNTYRAIILGYKSGMYHVSYVDYNESEWIPESNITSA